MYRGKGSKTEPIYSEQLYEIIKEVLSGIKDFSGKKVLVVIPDTTRSGPTDIIFKYIHKVLSSANAKKVDFLIALGTHPPMPEEKVNTFLNITVKDRKTIYRKTEIFQHEWDKPEGLMHIGTITASDMKEVSGGLMSEDIPVTINKKVLEYDEVILSGPVFPHEVVGFSGGYKYLFPGISGPDFLHKFHWLGALITNPKINGTKDTPVRRALNKAASFLKIPITLLCYVVSEGNIYGFYGGDTDAWAKAADLSAHLNIRYVDRPYRTVLSIAPPMYEDIWTAGKCMYKLEPVVANGGTLIIYAPHVKEVSHTHGKEIEKVGYHTRDYFLKQMAKFKDISGCILAHSTHVKGIGTFINGVEKPRIEVVLATGISEDICKKINLGYMDCRKIDIEKYRKQKDTLVVEKAGEVLYRLKDGSVPDINKLYQKNDRRF
ncbi:MAG: lactate racemase domain-containing protein [Candidatus Omnitrophica bacterium]|nr:lactate racemase domain-containing protein [Candidatus Omnitrophota bacterium]MCM8776695.1 lactate racemase domain-containing protein [Candidatus Omnitrophota bacterium]